MDIAGAKALKERLGYHGGDDAPAGPTGVPVGALPIYHYLGVCETPLEFPPAFDEASAERRSWLRGLRPG